MSHFAVLVIGEVDHNLAPFHEFECTGIDNEFVEEIDQTAEARSAYEKHKDDPDYPTFVSFVEGWYCRPAIAFGERPDLTSADKHKYGYAQLDEAGKIVKVIKRTNPNAKWDGYKEGGRWCGSLLTKDGYRVDSAQKGEVDFDAMRNEADDKLRAEYRDSGYNQSMSWRPWSEVFKDASFSTLEAKREFYHSQSDLAAVNANYRAAGRRDFMFEYDNFLGRTVEEYVDAVSSRGISAYAMVKDRQWCARGNMGWFGVSRDDIDLKSWANQLMEAILTLPDETTITVVDCHI